MKVIIHAGIGLERILRPLNYPIILDHYNLAWIEEHGTCKRKNHKKAIKHYQIAAEKGSQKSQGYLGRAKKATEKTTTPSMMTTFINLPFKIDDNL